jgi:hypothetical protein
MPKSDFKGKRFGKIKIIKEIEPRINKYSKIIRIWKYECDCGNIKVTKHQTLRRGKIKDCGCVKKLKASKDPIDLAIKKTWYRMKSKFNANRLLDNTEMNRPIKLCDEWSNDYYSFYLWCIGNGWRSNVRLVRKNKNDDYKPSNCIIKGPKGEYQQ